MTSKAMYVALIVGAGLAGCQSMHGGRPPDLFATKLKCGGQQCDVKVTVGSNCAITIDPEVLDLSEGSGSQDITWKLMTSGWEFSKNPAKYGIAIKTADPGGQFQPPSHHGTSITMKFKHKTPGRYFEYGVNVVQTSDELRCTKDPWVVE